MEMDTVELCTIELCLQQEKQASIIPLGNWVGLSLWGVLLKFVCRTLVKTADSSKVEITVVKVGLCLIQTNGEDNHVSLEELKTLANSLTSGTVLQLTLCRVGHLQSVYLSTLFISKHWHLCCSAELLVLFSLIVGLFSETLCNPHFTSRSDLEVNATRRPPLTLRSFQVVK